MPRTQKKRSPSTEGTYLCLRKRVGIFFSSICPTSRLSLILMPSNHSYSHLLWIPYIQYSNGGKKPSISNPSLYFKPPCVSTRVHLTAHTCGIWGRSVWCQWKSSKEAGWCRLLPRPPFRGRDVQRATRFLSSIPRIHRVSMCWDKRFDSVYCVCSS